MGKTGNKSSATKNAFKVPMNRISKAKAKKSKPVKTSLKRLNLNTRESVKKLNQAVEEIHLQMVTKKEEKSPVQKTNLQTCSEAPDVEAALKGFDKL